MPADHVMMMMMMKMIPITLQNWTDVLHRRPEHILFQLILFQIQQSGADVSRLQHETEGQKRFHLIKLK